MRRSVGYIATLDTKHNAVGTKRTVDVRFMGHDALFRLLCQILENDCSKIITNKMTLMDYPLFQG